MLLISAFAFLEADAKGVIHFDDSDVTPIAEAHARAKLIFGHRAVGEIEDGPTGKRRFSVRLSLPWDGKSIPTLVHAAEAGGRDVSRKISRQR